MSHYVVHYDVPCEFGQVKGVFDRLLDAEDFLRGYLDGGSVRPSLFKTSERPHYTIELWEKSYLQRQWVFNRDAELVEVT